MQTAFSDRQLEDPSIAEADRLLRRCVHCGLCTATCPTYLILGDERDSPRGRIYLMKDMFERGGDASPAVQRHIDRCLSCLSCMTACPSGVDYMHLVDIARVHVEKTGRRRLMERLLRDLLSRVLPDAGRFRLALKLATFVKPYTKTLRRLGFKELAAMIALAPARPPGGSRFEKPGTAVTTGERQARVLLLTGCVQKVLRPDINDATIRLLARGGVDVVVSAGAGCCGALEHHLGRDEAARGRARRNVDAWTKEMDRGPVDAIVVNASGCGTAVKDYGHLLKSDPAYASRAAKVSALARDVTEFVADHDIGPAKRWSSLRVAYHAACSLHHGQRIGNEPKTLLLNAGYGVADIPESHVCCGSAGTYNIFQSEIANELRDRKVRHIKSVKPDVVAAGNIGCIAQIAPSMDIPVVHTVELLDWAHGGPVPRGLESLAQFVTDVPKPRRFEDFIVA